MIVTTPATISAEVESFCAGVSPGARPLFLDIDPSIAAVALECFDNVKTKIAANGGSVQHGWRIWIWPGVMIEAEFHAVWKSPDGELVDITPCDERRILFLPDNSRSFTGTSPNNIRKPLSSDFDIVEFVKVTDDAYKLIVKQKEYPTPDNFMFVAALLEPLRERQEYLAKQISKRHPPPTRV